MVHLWFNNSFHDSHNCFREPSVSQFFSQLRLGSLLSRKQQRPFKAFRANP